jgi:hypothetical protein
MTLAKGVATVTCGLWLWAVGSSSANAEVINLAGGQLYILNGEDKAPKVQINDQEFDLGYGDASHAHTFT